MREIGMVQPISAFSGIKLRVEFSPVLLVAVPPKLP
jgi:hypothetical protein